MGKEIHAHDRQQVDKVFISFAGGLFSALFCKNDNKKQENGKCISNC
tara:strand:+ start:75 stop:215 length:141 start_codon:yes stop_codon:yes gene_type:complete